MKTQLLTYTTTALLAGGLLTFTSCSSIEGTEEVVAAETAEGAVIVDTFTTSATVTALDASKRKVTLTFPSGSRTTYKAGPEVVNFGQIQIGDRVKATVTEEVAIYLGQGAPPSAMASAGVALAPVGAKPGGVLVDTMQVTAKVTAIEAKKRKVTLELPDGTSKVLKVGKQADLASVKPGDTVTVQVSEGLALAVVKP